MVTHLNHGRGGIACGAARAHAAEDSDGALEVLHRVVQLAVLLRHGAVLLLEAVVLLKLQDIATTPMKTPKPGKGQRPSSLMVRL
jgi:hypothetical protein